MLATQIREGFFRSLTSNFIPALNFDLDSIPVAALNVWFGLLAVFWYCIIRLHLSFTYTVYKTQNIHNLFVYRATCHIIQVCTYKRHSTVLHVVAHSEDVPLKKTTMSTVCNIISVKDTYNIFTRLS